jgi:hypothetical protein
VTVKPAVVTVVAFLPARRKVSCRHRALLDALPMLGDRLTDAPPRLQQQLYEAFDLQALYKKNMHQVTIHITITDSTPQAVTAIINDADGHPAHTTPDPSRQAYFSDLAQAPM